MKSHKIIIIPGLGDNVKMAVWATRQWKNFGLEPVIYSFGWRDNTENFEQKLNQLTAFINGLVAKGDQVSLIGCSAGASAALNAFFERQDVVNKVISICGRLRAGNQPGFRSFASRTKTSPAFAESVKFFESREKLITEPNKKRIMTVRALLGDELVPSGTSTIRGAYNLTVPTPEHSLSIYATLKIFYKPLINFLNTL